MVSVLICVPSYDGKINISTMESIIKLVMMFSNQSIQTELFSICHESLIPRARNVCGCKLLQGKHTHLLFIDTDISFDAKDIFRMINAKKGIVCCLYPKKGYPIEFPVDEVRKCEDIDLCIATHGPTGLMLIDKNVFNSIYSNLPSEVYINDLEQYNDYTINGMLYNFFYT